MSEILHDTLPDDMITARALPGIQPVMGGWLHVDDAYAGQMARREDLLTTQAQDVVWMEPVALEPAQELLDMVCEALPALGFKRNDNQITCPDGRQVQVTRHDPLSCLGRLVQCDFCLLDRASQEHVLRGAVLCFPASWRLAEKAGRGLWGIHEPVKDYDDNLAKRVQRLFDGVKAGRPLWRFNQLWYDDPELHQPRSMTARRPKVGPQAPYFRAERQTILRLPRCNWVVFAIHTYVVRAEAVALGL